MTVQDYRDMVRPVLTMIVAISYYVVVIIATWNKMITGKEAVAAVTIPFMMMMTYHFAKATKKDSSEVKS